MRFGLGQLQFLHAVHGSLGLLDQGANASGVRFAVAVAGKRVGATTRFNQDVRPDEARLDVDGGHLGEIDANLVLAKPGAFVSEDCPIRHHNDRGEQVIPARPTARSKIFRIHALLWFRKLQFAIRCSPQAELILGIKTMAKNHRRLKSSRHLQSWAYGANSIVSAQATRAVFHGLRANKGKQRKYMTIHS